MNIFFNTPAIFLSLFVTSLFLPDSSRAASSLKNQSIQRTEDAILIEYDLPDADEFTTTLKISVDGGMTFTDFPAHMSGDIGPNLSGKNKKIVWEYKKDKIPGDPKEFLFQLEAFPQKFDMVPVAGGCFDMGDTFDEGWKTERPVHKVCVGDFFLSAHEITQGEWKEVVDKNPSSFNTCGDNCPVENVSLFDILSFLKALNSQTGREYRLPTEAEWEYAARNGGEKVRFGTGKNTLSPKGANFNADPNFQEKYSRAGSKSNGTVAVGTFLPNKLGLYDMAGNVWEWSNSRFTGGFYGQKKVNNPSVLKEGEFVVIRGGGWQDKPINLRNSRRSRVAPGFKSSDLGFRLAVTKL
ncbi:MAG: formylglycine-generating enzyme family protein [Nitrospinota bacterium]